MSKMFPFITKTWNPIGGACFHDCSYCWAKSLTEKYNFKKYRGDPFIDTRLVNKRFNEGEFVFVQDMSDLFAEQVPYEIIERVLEKIQHQPQAKFLLLTKNPSRYDEFVLPANTIAGATIETDDDELLSSVSRNCVPYESRCESMIDLNHPKMVSVEPIMRFSDDFPADLVAMCPQFVAVGYDNYNNGLVEPELTEVEALIALLESWKIKVYRKTLREANK
jgi:DNA repair photolyase